ncbi:hypothetical protein [Variovorax paradoxus]|uniref:hypothetical protein n=1 Tax=Variovorax paradoxus TaxID=34073 RepID=UPI001ABCE926
MSNDDPSAEDVAGLFRKFGGDSHVYKEFAPPEPTDGEGRAGWSLLSLSLIHIQLGERDRCGT